MRGSGGESERDTRGQTTLDFAIGATIFLFAVAFVFSFMPGVLQPFNVEGNPGSEVLAERSSAHLVNNLLSTDAYSNGPTRLSDQCTAAFFEGTNLPDCPYNGGPLDETFGTSARNSNINVTMEQLTGGVVDADIDDDGTSERLARGPVATNESTASTTRIVRVDGTTYRLVVQIW